MDKRLFTDADIVNLLRNRLAADVPVHASRSELIEILARKGGVLAPDAAFYHADFWVQSMQDKNARYQISCEAEEPFGYKHLIERFISSGNFDFKSIM